VFMNLTSALHKKIYNVNYFKFQNLIGMLEKEEKDDN